MSSPLQKLEKISLKKHIPLHIMFELTYKCNLKCVHCYVVNKNEYKELTTEEVKNILTQLADLGGLFITFTGGEIFVRPDILEILNYAKEKHFVIRFFTNGTLINKQIAKELSKIKVQEIGITIYASNQKIHDEITQKKGSFKKTLKALKFLKDEGIKIHLKCPLMKQNIRNVEEIKKLSKNLETKIIFDHSLTPRDNGDRSPLRFRLEDEELKSVLLDSDLFPLIHPSLYDNEKTSVLEKLQAENELQIEKQCNINFNLKLDETICDAGINLVSISPYGDVFPCLQMKIFSGNLREKNFSKIWKYSKVLKYLRKLKFSDLKICPTCNMKDYCFRCSAVAYIEDGDLLGPSSRACKIAKIIKNKKKL